VRGAAALGWRAAAGHAGRRALGAIPMLAAVSVVAYVLLYRAADPVARLRQSPTVRPDDIERLIVQQGLDRPWYVGYWRWLSGFVRGEWGVSATNGGVDAITPIARAIPATVELMLIALVLSAVLATALGVFAATRPRSAADHAVGVAAWAGAATPVFVVGALLQLAAIALREHGWSAPAFAAGAALVLVGLARAWRHRRRGAWIVAGVGAGLVAVAVALWGRMGAGSTTFYTGQRYSFAHEGQWFSVDHLQHLVLPVLTLAILNVAIWSRYQRAVMLDALRSDHVLAARARGIPERRVVLMHGLRSALGPLVMLVALDAGALLSGAVVTEAVFSWPGMGSLLRDAAVDRDINVAMGIVMITAVTMVAAGIAADLLQTALDPRVEVR